MKLNRNMLLCIGYSVYIWHCLSSMTGPVNDQMNWSSLVLIMFI